MFKLNFKNKKLNFKNKICLNLKRVFKMYEYKYIYKYS